MRDGRSATANATLRPRPFETSDAYQVTYGSVTSRGKKLRTIVTQPKDGGGKHPALFLIQGLGSFSIENTAGGVGAQETAHLVDGSLRLNEVRPDAAFSVRAIIDRTLPKKIGPEGRVSPPRRTDRLGVQKRLGERVAQAERQLEELSGSAGVRKDDDWTNFARAGFAAVGVLLLTAALICWRRGKR